MGLVKQINIKNRTYFYNGMINIKHFDPILLKIDKISYKDISIYDIGYITKLMIVKICTVYLIIAHANGYIEEKGKNKYLIFDSTDENKRLLKNTMMFGMESKTKSKK